MPVVMYSIGPTVPIQDAFEASPPWRLYCDYSYDRQPMQGNRTKLGKVR